MSTKNVSYPLLITLGLLLGMLLLYVFSPGLQQDIEQAFAYAEQGDQEALAKWFKQFGYWGPIGIVLFMVLQMFLVVFPSWLLMIVANIGYGPVWGTLIAITAVACASSIGYLLGRSLSQPLIDRLIGRKQARKLEGLVKRYGFGIVVLFRLSPLLSTDAISIVAGALRMSYGRYMLATLAGITPLAAAIAYFSEDLERLKQGLYWLGGAGLLLYSIYIWLDLRRRKQ
jgi:uncharacterized membrane protein YdjX (TVP38/TMEM64 family)